MKHRRSQGGRPSWVGSRRPALQPAGSHPAPPPPPPVSSAEPVLSRPQAGAEVPGAGPLIPHNGGASPSRPSQRRLCSQLPPPHPPGGSDLSSRPGVGPSTGGSWPAPHLARPGPGSRTHLSPTTQASRRTAGAGRQAGAPTTAILTTAHLPAESHTTDPDGPRDRPPRGVGAPACRPAPRLLGPVFRSPRARAGLGAGCSEAGRPRQPGRSSDVALSRKPLNNCPPSPPRSALRPSLPGSHWEQQNGSGESQILSPLKFGERKQKTF